MLPHAHLVLPAHALTTHPDAARLIYDEAYAVLSLQWDAAVALGWTSLKVSYIVRDVVHNGELSSVRWVFLTGTPPGGSLGVLIPPMTESRVVERMVAGWSLSRGYSCRVRVDKLDGFLVEFANLDRTVMASYSQDVPLPDNTDYNVALFLCRMVVRFNSFLKGLANAQTPG